MAFYEITYIARSELTDKDVEKITEEISASIKEEGGKVTKTEYWGLREFAYEIKKAKRGHYTHLRADAPESIVAKLERKLKLHEDVLRNLVVKTEELSDEDSAILTTDEEKDERAA